MIISALSCNQLCECYLNLYLKFGVIWFQNYKDVKLYQHMYQNVYCNLLPKKYHYIGVAFIKASVTLEIL